VSQRSYAEQPTFQLAHELLRSSVKHCPTTSVYDVRTLGVDDFDVVVFSGVYYHLKHPLLALAALRQVMAEGGTLIVEGPIIDNVRDSFASFFYRDRFANDVSNWWVPTLRCLREWIECSYFEITAETIVPTKATPGIVARLVNGIRGAFPRIPVAHVAPIAGALPRCVISARAVCREDKVYVFPDGELAKFNVAGRIGSQSR
jgi:tRNA (mo5U34)-methyltransferase